MNTTLICAVFILNAAAIVVNLVRVYDYRKRLTEACFLLKKAMQYNGLTDTAVRQMHWNAINDINVRVDHFVKGNADYIDQRYLPDL